MADQNTQDQTTDWTHGKSDEDLLRDAVRCARPRYRAGPRWAAVMETFALGSSYSFALCRRFGFDPEEKIKRHG